MLAEGEVQLDFESSEAGIVRGALVILRHALVGGGLGGLKDSVGRSNGRF